MNNDPYPCPFCGLPAIATEGQSAKFPWRVACTGRIPVCRAAGPKSATREGAITAWNAAPRPFGVLVDDMVVIYKPITVQVTGAGNSAWMCADGKIMESVIQDETGWRLERGGASYPSRLHLARAFTDEVVSENLELF